MNSTAAGLPFTVTDVPSRLIGNLPLTISVASFHLRESPAGARPVPKMATHAPAEMAPPAVKLASFTMPVIAGFAGGAVGAATNTQAAPLLPLSPSPPTMAVSPSLDNATETP